MQPSLLSLLATLGLAAGASAQIPSFNIDVGANLLYPTPASTFSAGTSQAGFWSPIDANAAGSLALTDINGVPSSITVTITGANVNYEFPNTGTPAGSDEEKLMDDLQDIGATGGTTFWSIGPMPPGPYKVTFYSWAPDNRSYTTDITLTGGSNGTMVCGNAVGWPGFVLGQTFVQDTVQITSGNLTFTASTNTGFGNLNGLQIEPGTPAPVSYCTAKTNSLGCTPTMGFNGTPSATTGSGFLVLGANVRNNKSGLLFYGVNGPSANPFQGGTLCVKSPIRRTPAVNSGGTPIPANDCTGVYSLDMNAFAVGALGGSPLPALQVQGTIVHCQYWGRDPGFPAPNNTTLTDGLQYVVGP